MSRFIKIIFFMLFFGNTACADSFLQGRLANLLPRNAPWAMVAVDLQTGRENISVGTALKEPLVPASLVKLFITGAVLDYSKRGKLDMGTQVLHDGTIRDGTLTGNLYLVGKGNALLTTDDLKKAARRVTEQGIGRITGDIVADDTIFDTKGLERKRKGPGYAPAGALGLDLHTVAVTVTPTEAGKPPKVTIEPPNNAVRLAIEARTAETAANSIKVTQLDDTAYRVTGNIATDSGPLKWRFPLQEPALYAAGALKAELKRVEVRVDGNARKGKTSEDAQILVEMDAPSLERLIDDMNMNSLNVLADNLLLLLGAERFGAPGTREKGLKAVNEFLGTFGLPEGEATIADGSGLSEGNRVTAGYMAHYLQKVAQKPWFPNFRDSLPRSGMDGTLKHMDYRNERFHVKSGRLENAFALAGYGVDWKGREIAFACIVNLPGASAVNLERSGAEVMRYLGTGVLQ